MAQRGAFARLAAAVGLMGFAAVALASGIDRASVEQPDLASYVPAPFVASALQILGQRAMVAHDGPTTGKIGAALINRQPINAAGPALLGYSRLLSGDGLGAEKAFRVSGGMGWRMPLTQEYWMRRAMAAQDYRVGALRLDALLRQTPALVNSPALLDMFETVPDARAAMVERMTLHPDWLPIYASDVASASRATIMQRATVLADLGKRGSILGCAGIQPVVYRLVGQDAVGNAADIWRMHCPNPDVRATLVWDGGLSQFDSNAVPSPLGWALIGSGEVSVSRRPVIGGGQMLDITSTTDFSAPLIRQMIVVPAGTYRLAWQASDSANAGLPRIAPQVRCEKGGSQDYKPEAMGPGMWATTVQVDAACAGHWLQFMIRPGAGTVTFGKITLIRA
jgi:hypothetical protein